MRKTAVLAAALEIGIIVGLIGIRSAATEILGALPSPLDAEDAMWLEQMTSWFQLLALN